MPQQTSGPLATVRGQKCGKFGQLPNVQEGGGREYTPKMNVHLHPSSHNNGREHLPSWPRGGGGGGGVCVCGEGGGGEWEEEGGWGEGGRGEE